MNINTISYIFSGFSYSVKSAGSLYVIKGTILLTLFFYSTLLYSQNNSADSLPDTVKVHSAKRATLYSMILPGLGQAYNKQYWKIPAIYVGFGTLAYFRNLNHNEFVIWKDLYKRYLEGDSAVVGIYNPEFLKNAEEYYRKNRDLCTIGLFGLYILNVVDASVYAHFFDYDISDDLSIRIEPALVDQAFAGGTLGIRCRIKF